MGGGATFGWIVLEEAKNGEVTTNRGQKEGGKGGRAKYGQDSTEGGQKRERTGLKRVNKGKHKEAKNLREQD